VTVWKWRLTYPWLMRWWQDRVAGRGPGELMSSALVQPWYTSSGWRCGHATDGVGNEGWCSRSTAASVSKHWIELQDQRVVPILSVADGRRFNCDRGRGESPYLSDQTMREVVSAAERRDMKWMDWMDRRGFQIPANRQIHAVLSFLLLFWDSMNRSTMKAYGLLL
jgi:hypothetical protein